VMCIGSHDRANVTTSFIIQPGPQSRARPTSSPSTFLIASTQEIACFRPRYFAGIAGKANITAQANGNYRTPLPRPKAVRYSDTDRFSDRYAIAMDSPESLLRELTP